MVLVPKVQVALCGHLLEKPALYLDEIAIFLWDEFALRANKSSISRALKSKGWSKKAARVEARERLENDWSDTRGSSAFMWRFGAIFGWTTRD
ncbi:hypothetical protein PENSUB_6462 [Penicillium subrubescens]|uniref:Winged helix-turn helix domain-containing protein n=1 Tax=Penicillium subrubescens TaxID=1316194 RepID=A0A1Q5U1X2_9EURO|nr:hypothetical protein PENSUB_6462 [Penicillium subrubescens]